MTVRVASLIYLLFTVAVTNVCAEESCAFILSGYESSTSKGLYQKIGQEYQSAGIRPIYIEIDWSTSDITDYVAQAKSYMSKCGAINQYFYGFSMGGVIALALAAEEEPVSLVVSSIAPFFKEDLEKLAWYSPHKIYKWWLFGDSESISMTNIVTSINKSKTKVVLLVGSKEKEKMLQKSKSLASDLINADLFVMDGLEHGVSQNGHIDHIVSSFKKHL